MFFEIIRPGEGFDDIKVGMFESAILREAGKPISKKNIAENTKQFKYLNFDVHLQRFKNSKIFKATSIILYPKYEISRAMATDYFGEPMNTERNKIGRRHYLVDRYEGLYVDYLLREDRAYCFTIVAS